MYKISVGIICLFIWMPAAVAQVLVIRDCDPHEIQKNFAAVIQINGRDVIAIDGVMHDNNLIINKLEEKYDATRFYFILYPATPYSIDALKRYGKVLYRADSYIVFKTSIGVLNDHEVFRAFKIVGFDNRPTRWSRKDDAMMMQHGGRPVPDTTISRILTGISVDSVWKQIEKLQTLERYTTSPDVTQSVSYLTDYFRKLDFDTVCQHTWQAGSSPNIIGIKYGKTAPEEIYIIDGHYDCTAPKMPAADDNGSGTAGVMEAARVLTKYSFKKTMRFVLFSGEEIGLKGSAAYARDAKNKKETIQGVINLDMIGWNNSTKVEVFIAFQKAKPAFYNAFRATAAEYIPGILCVDGSGSMWLDGSDHASFWNNGYDNAIYLGDDLVGKNHPYYHKSSDVLGTSVNSKSTAEMFLKAATANLASLAEVWHPGTFVAANSATAGPRIRVFFNRASGSVTFSPPEGIPAAKAEIVNANGRRVRTYACATRGAGGIRTIDCSGIPDGIYFLRLTGSSGAVQVKLPLLGGR